MKDIHEMLPEIEKMIEIRIIQEDAETIFSLMKTERNPIFAMMIMPYYALFVQSCQEYMGEIYIEGVTGERIKNIRNYLKTYGNTFGKSKKRVERVDAEQDEQYKSQLRFDFMKNWNIHYNLGTYWTEDKHIIGNTQLIADFLEVQDIFDSQTGPKQFELGREIGSFVSSIREGIAKSISPPKISRKLKEINIEFFYNLNTNRFDELFLDNSSKILNLFYLNLVCSLNFIKLILRPLLADDNQWLFRIEYVVTYYAYRAIQRLVNYCENNEDLQIEIEQYKELLNLSENLFQTKFRNCMMHYGIRGKDVLSIDNIEKPFYGIVETCYEGIDYHMLLTDLRKVADRFIVLLESYFDGSNISLERL